MAKLRNRVAVWALLLTLGGAWEQAARAQEKSAQDVAAQDPGSQDKDKDGNDKAKDTDNDKAKDTDKDTEGGLVIEPQELPGTYPHGPYQVNFHARGNYVPVLRWTIGSGALPPGIVLDDGGSLHGEAQKAGEYQFVVVVRDGGKPQQAFQHGYTIKVTEAITLKWKAPPRVNSNRIDGSVEVSNTTQYDMDLTFDVKAVAENGRATEIGYQHFALKRGTMDMALPFGETLPHGGYTVYVNVVGEVAARNTIYREALQTPGPLQVVVGP
jgi:hypothetical protein